MTSVGSATGNEKATITENGSIIITDSSTASQTANIAFSAFGAFINNFPACDGPLVYGTLSGPIYANGQWNFGSGGSYTFTDPVDQTGQDSSYSTRAAARARIAPPFLSKVAVPPSALISSWGITSAKAAIALPANSYSQQWAVLDGLGCGEHSTTCGNPASLPPAPTNAEMNAVLLNVNQTPYPTTGASSGVYIPYTCTSGVCSVNSNGGGGTFHVEGSSSVSTGVTLSTANGAGGSSNPFGPGYSGCPVAGAHDGVARGNGDGRPVLHIPTVPTSIHAPRASSSKPPRRRPPPSQQSQLMPWEIRRRCPLIRKPPTPR